MNRTAMMGLIEMALALYASQPSSENTRQNEAAKNAKASVQKLSVIMLVASCEGEA